MQHIFTYAALVFLMVVFCSIAYSVYVSDLDVEPMFQARLDEVFLSELKRIDSRTDILLEETRYLQSGGSGRRLIVWRVVRAKDGDFYSFRATVRDNQMEHSIIRVGSRDVRRWMFWHPAGYKSVFGHARQFSDLFSFSSMNQSVPNRLRRKNQKQ
jgi:hypothetical protein